MSYALQAARQLRRRPGRALLTLLSIAIGVSAAVSVQLAASTVRRAYRQMSTSVGGHVALEIVSEDGARFDQSITERVGRAPGVAQALPLLHRATIVYCKGQRAKLVAIGLDFRRYTAELAFKLKAGRLPGQGDDDVLLEAGMAHSLRASAGEPLKLLSRRGVVRTDVAGIIDAPNIDTYLRGESLLVPLQTLQAWFALRGKIDTVQLVLNQDLGTRACIDTIQPTLPPGLVVREPLTRGRIAEETLLSTELGLDFAVGLSLGLAVFIMLNTLMMNVSERRTEFSVLRLIGATRRQVMRMVLTEALLLALLGTLLGLALGAFGARALEAGMQRLLEVPAPAQPFHPTTLLLLAVILGPVIALVGASLPAWRANQLSPLSAMVPTRTDSRSSFPRGLTFAALLIFVASEALVACAATSIIPPILSIPSGISAMLAFVLLMPAIVAPASRLLAVLMRPIFPAEIMLVERELVRHRTRTALTSGVIVVAVSNGIGMGTAVLDMVADVRHWYQHTMVADFLLQPANPADTEAASGPDSASELLEKLRALPDVEQVDTVRFVTARANGVPIELIVKQFSSTSRLALDLKQGGAQEVRSLLEQGEVVLSTILAKRLKLRIGDHVLIETGKGSRRLRIAGLANEYAAGGLAAYMQQAPAARLLGTSGFDLLLLGVAHPDRPQIEHELQQFAGQHHLTLLSFADFRHYIDGLMFSVIAAFWALLALGFVVAAFGIVNTLMMSLAEQMHELCLLRVIGMTRRQLRRMILSQSIVMGLFGAAVGALAGLVIAYMIHLCLMPLTGRDVPFRFHGLLIVACCGGSLLVVVLASLLPALRATRLGLIDALQDE